MARLRRGYLRITYLVQGKNIRYLPSYLHFRKVNALECKVKSDSECELTIDFKDRYIFFAICKNMCYNKKVVKYKGILSPFARFFVKAGVCLGVISFILLSWVLNGIVLDIKVEGSAKCFERETLSLVSVYGIKKYSSFKSVDYTALENAILSSNQKISFVSVYKRGNSLVINAELSSSISQPLVKYDGDLVSSVDGVVEEISVLRGTALVTLGQEVKKGDTLVGAYLTDKDGEVYKSFTVARVKILETLTFEYENANFNNIELYYAISKFKVSELEVYEKRHEIIGDKIVITLTVRHVLYGGNS